MPQKEVNFYPSKNGHNFKLIWPNQLTSPKELMLGLRNNTKLHLIKSPIYSKIVLQFIGSWSYFLAHCLNRTKISNVEVFKQELRRVEDQVLSANSEIDQRNVKSKTAPLLTFSNHISCIDDPVLWACLLPLNYYSTHTDIVRWSAAALEICFSKPWHSSFFSLGKTFPIMRGAGLEQPAMDFALGLLRYNQWLHLFPEGKVMRDDHQQKISNEKRGYIFKWGISKLILDYFKDNSCNKNTPGSNKTIRILPFYHLGMDDILPIGWPYIPKAGKRISIYIRPSVIEMNSNFLRNTLANRTLANQQLIKSKSNDDITRIKLTNYLEEEHLKLTEPAEKLHRLDSG